MRYRLLVEVEYFIALCEIPLPQLKKFPSGKFSLLRNTWKNFTEKDAIRIKEIEKTTNHDVKAIEYFLQEKFQKNGLASFISFIHFGLTSQDINNSAVPMMVRDAIDRIFLPSISEIISHLNVFSDEWRHIPMLARTHGQPASPTFAGKEIAVFIERLENQVKLLQVIPHTAKFGGAVGNFNAHYAACPGIDWHAFADSFVREKLHLIRLKTTTQIDHYDNFAATCDGFKRINNILINLCRDFWHYISLGYFTQKIDSSETGSSTMPHKVNPIDFENAEGNLGIANALFEHLAAKLPVSRLQRDLSDSTVIRNTGVPFAHTLIAIKSLLKGLKKISLNRVVISEDLEKHWEVVSEAIQVILRREGHGDAYEQVKTLTRKNESFSRSSIIRIIDNLKIPSSLKKELKKITPDNYTGVYLPLS